jgi:hypothetical protein
MGDGIERCHGVSCCVVPASASWRRQSDIDDCAIILLQAKMTAAIPGARCVLSGALPKMTAQSLRGQKYGLRGPAIRRTTGDKMAPASDASHDTAIIDERKRKSRAGFSERFSRH